jgi:flagellar FliL protein
VGFDVNGRQRFMQVFISAQARTQDAIAAMEFHMPTIRSRLLSAYSSQEFATLQTEAGKLALLETTLNIINGVLEQEKSPLIENVYFTNFVLQ